MTYHVQFEILFIQCTSYQVLLDIIRKGLTHSVNRFTNCIFNIRVDENQNCRQCIAPDMFMNLTLCIIGDLLCCYLYCDRHNHDKIDNLRIMGWIIVLGVILRSIAILLISIWTIPLAQASIAVTFLEIPYPVIEMTNDMFCYLPFSMHKLKGGATL